MQFYKAISIYVISFSLLGLILYYYTGQNQVQAESVPVQVGSDAQELGIKTVKYFR